MTVKRRGLGRGLDALLSSSGVNASKADSELRNLAIDVLQKGKYQPRKDIQPEALQELADSIRKQGIIQPIVVREISQGRYEIIAGERRWRAAQLAGLTEIPVLIRNVADEAAIAMALIENIQREDLNPMEEAVALQRLLDEFKMTHQQVAEAVGKSRSTVTNLMRLLSLQEEVRTFVEQNKLEMGHARALLALQGPGQFQAARTIIDKGLSVREAERLVTRLQQEDSLPTKQPKLVIAPDVRRLQKQFSDQLGATVTLQHNSKGKGKVVIHYNSLEELEGILAHIK